MLDEPNARRKAYSKLGAIWCGLMHNTAMWPIHGEYQCRTCGRHCPVPWAGARLLPVHGELIYPETLQVPASQIRPTSLPSFRSALLPLIVVLATLLPSHARAAEAPIVGANDRAAMAFARYISGLAQTRPWSLETIEIDASLPKVQAHGRLRAIRRLVSQGKPEYQVLEIAGDQTVKQQVIFRYLSADAQAAEVPASTVAITPANYKFSYKGAATVGRGTAYSFVIKPRKKRAGLIKGELWLDGETGAVVRQSGYFVKSPSIFVKRITETRETTLRDGLAEERITRLSVDTRLIGRAELTIRESPRTDSDSGSAPHTGE